MDRTQAAEFVKVIEAAMGFAQEITIKRMELVDGMVLGFDTNIDGRDAVGAFEFTMLDGQKYFLFFVPWRLDERYYLVLHVQGILNALIGTAEVHGKVVHWRYKPSKRDGRNEERKQRFVAEYGSLMASMHVPQIASEVEDFLKELVEVAQVRIHAEGLSNPVSCHGRS